MPTGLPSLVLLFQSSILVVSAEMSGSNQEQLPSRSDFLSEHHGGRLKTYISQETHTCLKSELAALREFLNSDRAVLKPSEIIKKMHWTLLDINW